jgi:ribulose-bisphosphate carboxylase small chain
LAKEVDYLIRNKWIPCVEFELEHGFVYREHGNTPGYYDGRYWTMWKLPLFGCTDSAQVLKEVEECKKEYPEKNKFSSFYTQEYKFPVLQIFSQENLKL